MDNELKLNLNVEANNNEIIITHRTGEAPDVEVPIQFKYIGNIDSPGNFFYDRNKRGLINNDLSHVVINIREGVITLVENEISPKQTIIIGKLKKNPDLENFGIWTKFYTHDELIKFLRKNKRFFNEKEQFDKLMKSLSDFQFEREITGKVKNDRKGNLENNYKQELKQNVQLEFTLAIPLFEGEKRHTFHAELFPEVTDGGTRWWIESVELLELFANMTEEILALQIVRFNDILILYES